MQDAVTHPSRTGQRAGLNVESPRAGKVPTNGSGAGAAALPEYAGIDESGRAAGESQRAIKLRVPQSGIVNQSIVTGRAIAIDAARRPVDRAVVDQRTEDGISRVVGDIQHAALRHRQCSVNRAAVPVQNRIAGHEHGCVGVRPADGARIISIQDAVTHPGRTGQRAGLNIEGSRAGEVPTNGSGAGAAALPEYAGIDESGPAAGESQRAVKLRVPESGIVNQSNGTGWAIAVDAARRPVDRAVVG